ncbi:MAG TPA: hypothetical protein VMV92_15075 [Streptosporangiaceae bacterium]|nr:hypothetical protein [Streptosporangiaceae bacterium]
MSPPVLRMATWWPNNAEAARNTQAHFAQSRHQPSPLVRLQLAVRR